jgi:SPP1 gp7 family putative phage head morphogenesis protein
MLSAEQIDTLLMAIYQGKATRKKLPEYLYHAIAEPLIKQVKKGYKSKEGKGKIKNSSTLLKAANFKKKTLASLQENIYIFSAAKTYQEVRAVEAMMTEGGKLRPFKEFKQLALEKYDLYNKTWAQTEYDTAFGQAQSAAAWDNIQSEKEALPLLRYSAIIDENTSDICAPLDGMVASVDDPIWDSISPLNHYNCRCVLLQEPDDTTPTEGNDDRVAPVLDNMDDVFKTNPGKNGEVFNKEHPYFTEVPASDKAYARKNFNLPIPQDL